jgi:ABC-type branched-subunit amino acid transport system substrate-binding protein
MVVRIPAAPSEREVAPTPDALPPADRRDRYSVAFLLPFSQERNDSVMASSRDAHAMHVTTRIAAQFYAGAQLAMEEMQRRGLVADLDVSVVDIGETPAQWNARLNESTLLGRDLYIGPFHREAVERLARMAPEAHIVNPTTQSNKLVLGLPNVSKVKAAPHDLARFMARHVAARHAADNVILVKPEIFAERELRGQVHRALDASLQHQPARLRDSVLVVRTGRRDVGDLLQRLQEGRRNVLVVPSEDVEFVTNLVNVLRKQTGKYDMLVFGMESWRGMNTIAAEDLDRIRLHVAVNGYMDMYQPGVQAFVQAFRERFHAEPQEYAFLGYDVTLYYLSALVQEGRGFAHRLALVRPELLHMTLALKQAGPESGYVNEMGVIIAHRDMAIHRVP